MNRNSSVRFWARVHYLGFLTFAIVTALVCVKILSVGLALVLCQPMP